MILKSSRISPFYQFKHLAAAEGVLHFVSSRHGGISKGACSSMNLQFTDYDIPAKVQENRNRMAGAVGFSPAMYTTAEQVHRDGIAIVDNSMAGNGAYSKADAIKGVDAMITALPDICLMVRSADCVPLLLYDPKQNVIAAIHAGWRSTLLQIAAKTVRQMQDVFNVDPHDILAGIGPSIGACCFEIGEVVVTEIYREQQAHFLKTIQGKAKQHFDLWACNAEQLRTMGVQKIELAACCTSCMQDEFFSYRRNGVQTGQLGTGIVLKG